MTCSPTGDEMGLVGYWNFEEGSGNTAYDQTSNGNDGNINGASYDTNVPSQSCNLTNVNVNKPTTSVQSWIDACCGKLTQLTMEVI